VKEYDDHHDARTQGDGVGQAAAQDSAGTRNTNASNSHRGFADSRTGTSTSVADLSEPLSPLDENLSDADFTERDQFQMGVPGAAGPPPVARELLDRVNPAGSWAKKVPALADG
jgi:hypothetical protein